MKSTLETRDPAQTIRLSLRQYLTGYGLSMSCTVIAYTAVRNHMNAKGTLIATVTTLALAQFMVQLMFFLHLGYETKPRWKVVIFYFALLIVGILVFGSLWIMNNLNYRMTPQQINTYMEQQDGGI